MKPDDLKIELNSDDPRICTISFSMILPNFMIKQLMPFYPLFSDNVVIGVSKDGVNKLFEFKHPMPHDVYLLWYNQILGN